MKKILSIFLAIMVVFTLTGCKGLKGYQEFKESEEAKSLKTPTEVTDYFLKSMQGNFNANAMKRVYAGKIEGIDIERAIMENSDDKKNNAETAMSKLILHKLFDFKYKIQSEKIKGKKATVKVNWETYNFDKILGSANIDKAKNEDEGMKLIKKKISEARPNKKLTIEFTLSKKNNSWIVDDLNKNEKFFKALTGYQ